MDTKIKVDEFVAVTLLAAIKYKGTHSLYDFAEINDDYGFGICEEDVDIEALYVEDEMETFERWHIKANELFLKKRSEMIDELQRL